MHWDLFAKNLKQLIAKVAPPQSLSPEDDSDFDDSIHTAPSAGDRYDEEQMTPYSPDSRSERSDSSLHLSC